MGLAGGWAVGPLRKAGQEVERKALFPPNTSIILTPTLKSLYYTYQLQAFNLYFHFLPFLRHDLTIKLLPRKCGF